MTSLRQLGRSRFARLLARVLIAALLFALVPIPAETSIPTGSLPEPSPLKDLAAAASEPVCLVVIVVIVVADPSGLTKTAFGELIAHTGTDPQPYAFAGEPLDPNSGFQYHRARWMDPRAGRFISTDSAAGHVFDPPSLHRYLYVADDPVNKVDPTGREWSLAGVLTVGAIIGTIAGISIGATIAHFRGLTIREAEFWYWVGGGAVAGATVGALAGWALVTFGWVSVGAGAGASGPAVNWLTNNANRAWHILQPGHAWERIVNFVQPNTNPNALTNYEQLVPHFERITATIAPRSIQLANGAQKLIYEGVYLGQNVTLRIWVSPTGQQIVEDAWIVTQ